MKVDLARGRRLARIVVGLAGIAGVAFAGSVWAGPADLPNLRPLQVSDVIIDLDDDGLQQALRFQSQLENFGPAALELRARAPMNLRTARAEQCVGWVGPLCRTWRESGTLTHEPSDLEQCWSLQGAFRYELRRLDDAQLPVWSDDGLIRRADVPRWFQDDAADSDYSGADGPAQASRYPACVGLSRQGLSPGHVTFFPADWHGQQLPVTGLADGTYALVTTFDPNDLIDESDEADNASWTKVRIAGNGTSASLVP